jgi:hypothetical protein
MLGEHRLIKLAAALAIGTGIVLSMGAAAGAAEGPAIGPAPFQLRFPDGTPPALIRDSSFLKRSSKTAIAAGPATDVRDAASGMAASRGLFDFSNKSHPGSPGGLLGLSDGSVLAHAFADIPAAPKLVLNFSQSDLVQLEVAQLPIPGTVWLFLAALALLFGISRRHTAGG